MSTAEAMLVALAPEDGLLPPEMKKQLELAVRAVLEILHEAGITAADTRALADAQRARATEVEDDDEGDFGADEETHESAGEGGEARAAAEGADVALREELGQRLVAAKAAKDDAEVLVPERLLVGVAGRISRSAQRKQAGRAPSKGAPRGDTRQGGKEPSG